MVETVPSADPPRADRDHARHALLSIASRCGLGSSGGQAVVAISGNRGKLRARSSRRWFARPTSKELEMSVLIDTGRLDLGSARRALQASLTGATGAHTHGCSATRKTCLRDSRVLAAQPRCDLPPPGQLECQPHPRTYEVRPERRCVAEQSCVRSDEPTSQGGCVREGGPGLSTAHVRVRRRHRFPG
jgi:hypothetical protein